MRIIFAGSGEFGIPSLRALLDAGHQVFPYTQPHRPAGRGRKITPTPVAQFCESRALPAVSTADFNAEKLPEADLMVVIAFGQKIAPHVVNHARLGSINLHASKLPRLRGAAPIHWAILRGENETGNSIIRLAEKMDAGAILAQSSVSIGKTETTGELHDRLSIDGVELIFRVIRDLDGGVAQETPQDESRATVAPKLTRQFSLIDWNVSADTLARKIRGLSPWPGCRVSITDAEGAEKARATLLRATCVEGEGPRWHPGEITIYGHVAAGDGAVEILDLQPDGKRPMTLSDYRRGNPWFPGLRLVSI